MVFKGHYSLNLGWSVVLVLSEKLGDGDFKGLVKKKSALGIFEDKKSIIHFIIYIYVFIFAS
jgi:hypothetical protein